AHCPRAADRSAAFDEWTSPAPGEPAIGGAGYPRFSAAPDRTLTRCSGLNQTLQLGFERMSARFEPLALSAPIRTQRLDQIPEARRMVAIAQMAQLVDHDVAQCLRRREGEGKIERDHIARVQTAPQTLQGLHAHTRGRA